jgi:hypothetical protein
MKTKLLAAGILAMGFCSSLWAIEGKAAAVVFQNTVYTSQGSRLMVVAVSGNSVVRTDTILKRAVYYHPTWSFDGRRIAFYTNGGPFSFISVINAGGTNLRNVASFPGTFGLSKCQAIAWPGTDAGKWIYYHRLCNAGCWQQGSGEIWKVNVDDTTQKSMVCDFTKVNEDPPAGWASPSLEGWHLSTDAKYSAITLYGTQASLGYTFHPVIAFTFPPQVNSSTQLIDPNLTAPQCNNCIINGCNSAISASGQLVYNFLGPHNQLYASFWDHAAKTAVRYTIGTGPNGSLDQYKDIEPWLTTTLGMGSCITNPHGSCNSDRVVIMMIDWAYVAGYDGTGNNQVVVDWKNKKAVYTTHNPDLRGGAGHETPTTKYWCTEPGDFWVDGGAANPGTKYQAIDGSWVEVPGAVSVAPDSRAVRKPSDRGAPAATVTAFTLTGARVGVAQEQAFRQGSTGKLLRGCYIMVGQGIPAKRMALNTGVSVK